jgi:hypothetical protein
LSLFAGLSRLSLLLSLSLFIVVACQCCQLSPFVLNVVRYRCRLFVVVGRRRTPPPSPFQGWRLSSVTAVVVAGVAVAVFRRCSFVIKVKVSCPLVQGCRVVTAVTSRLPGYSLLSGSPSLFVCHRWSVFRRCRCSVVVRLVRWFAIKSCHATVRSLSSYGAIVVVILSLSHRVVRCRRHRRVRLLSAKVFVVKLPLLSITFVRYSAVVRYHITSAARRPRPPTPLSSSWVGRWVVR